MRMQLQDRDVLSILINAMEIHFRVLRESREPVEILNDIDDFTNLLWESLNQDNKVSLCSFH